MILLLLALIYPLAVQYEKHTLYPILYVLFPLYVVAGILDVLANYIELSLILQEWPKPKQYTVSSRISELLFSNGWKRNTAYMVARYLNYFSPNHISELSNDRATTN